MTIHENAIAADMPAGLRAPAGGGRPFACSSATLPGLVLLLDALAIAGAGVASVLALPGGAAGHPDDQVLCIGVVLVASLVLLKRSGHYQIETVMRPVAPAEGVSLAVFGAVLLFLGLAFLLKLPESFSRVWIVGFGAGATVLVTGLRAAVRRGAEALSRRGVIGRTIVVLGGGEQARQFLRRIGAVQPPFTRVGGVFLPRTGGSGASVEGCAVIGGPDALIEAARAGRIDDVVVALPWREHRRLSRTVERLRELPVAIYMASDLVGYHVPLRPAPVEFSGLPLFEVAPRPISGWSSVVKRIEDLVLGSLILVALAPVLGLIALAIRLDSPGPVLFRQKRLGFNNQVFSIYKFRSMHHRQSAEPATGRVEPQATRHDPRITRIGRLIRRTSLDELPQLLNVLEGSMSLVGPRPHALSHNAEYGRRIRGYFARHKVKPGMTGWAQVNGLRGETARLGLMKERVRHDSHYVDNWSVLLDLRILFMTALVLPFQRSAY